MRTTSLPLACLLATAAVACDDDVKTGDPDDVTETTCEATFAILQKDAYKETAGRSSELWPPHTTNTLTVTCDGEVVREAVAANHGTLPGAKDAAGVVILQEMKTIGVEGTRGELSSLADAFEACSCDAETQFLSLDSLSETAVSDLVGELTEYLGANLVCSDGVTTEEVLGYLTNGQIEETIIGLTYCSWASGATFDDGLDEALEAVIAATADTLADYHVCNNDALLQVDLVTTFVDTGKVTPCDPAVATCRGPVWFYNP
jgi:hypothetical protein